MKCRLTSGARQRKSESEEVKHCSRRRGGRTCLLVTASWMKGVCKRRRQVMPCTCSTVSHEAFQVFSDIQFYQFPLQSWPLSFLQCKAWCWLFKKKLLPPPPPQWRNPQGSFCRQEAGSVQLARWQIESEGRLVFSRGWRKTPYLLDATIHQWCLYLSDKRSLGSCEWAVFLCLTRNSTRESFLVTYTYFKEINLMKIGYKLFLQLECLHDCCELRRVAGTEYRLPKIQIMVGILFTLIFKDSFNAFHSFICALWIQKLNVIESNVICLKCFLMNWTQSLVICLKCFLMNWTQSLAWV